MSPLPIQYLQKVWAEPQPPAVLGLNGNGWRFDGFDSPLLLKWVVIFLLFMISHFLERKWTMKYKLNVIFDVNIIESLKENEKSIEHDFR